MKIKVDGHMLIAFIFSFLAIVISIIITLISVSYRPFSFDFPAYAYHEYGKQLLAERLYSTL